MLKPSSKSQEEMIIAGLSEILIRAAEGDEAIFCLPGPGTKFNLSGGLTPWASKMERAKMPQSLFYRIRLRSWVPFKVFVVL